MSIGQRSQRVDVIRGVSILLVLFHHFVITYRLNDTTLARIVGSDAIRVVARNGNYGVTMFFVVSGYLITSNARRRWGGLWRVQPRSFYGLRIARISCPASCCFLSPWTPWRWQASGRSRTEHPKVLRWSRFPTGFLILRL